MKFVEAWNFSHKIINPRTMRFTMVCSLVQFRVYSNVVWVHTLGLVVKLPDFEDFFVFFGKSPDFYDKFQGI